MDKETREKIHKILDLVIDRNENGNATFFYFSGHINAITVDLHAGKWEPMQKLETHCTYINKQDLDKSLDEVIKALC